MRQRLFLLTVRQEFPNAWSADEPFNKEKAERLTPNVELGMTAHYLAFFSAVLMLATKIRISSSTSLKQITKFGGDPSFFARPTSSNHRFVSRSSLRQIRSLCRKSLSDSAASTSP